MKRFGTMIMFLALSSLAAIGCGDSNDSSGDTCTGTETCINAPCSATGTVMYKICTTAGTGCAKIVYKTSDGTAKATCTCGAGCDTTSYTTCNSGGMAKACM
jgi:hypothetical protein